MKTSDFDYYLPENLIAQTPLAKRDSSRLMVLNRNSNTLEHHIFSDIIDYINPGDILVINATRVLHARLLGFAVPSGGRQELMLTKPLGDGLWEGLMRPGKRARIGSQFEFGSITAEVTALGEGGLRTVRLIADGDMMNAIEQEGVMPLPPYIKDKLGDDERYQTVYGKQLGSVAAPTAGLHFTDELLGRIQAKGVGVHSVLLNVGLGTFLPVKSEDLGEHRMHSEWYELPKATADAVNGARHRGGRVFAVGTTSVRALESSVGEDGKVRATSGETEIFITPGYRFKAVDALITNFHLPKSTLMMLVSAFYDRERILSAYREAVEREYRFFSFGDAMLIL